jgi:hypothetical protein
MAVRPPVLGIPPESYDRGFFDRFVQELRGYFDRANAPVPGNLATLNISMKTLPTQASLATLASGDVYVDTTAGNVLKIKP